jgi:hypothetical protein
MTYQEKIQKIVNSIDDVIVIAQTMAINEIYAYTKERIFNKGLAKDISSIGRYSESYKEVRKSKGLQTSFVDLKVTGSLQDSIVRDDKQIFFKNEYGRKVAGYNEVHFKGKENTIFAPTGDDKQIYFDILNDELNKLWKS